MRTAEAVVNDSPVDCDGVPRSEIVSFGGSRLCREVTEDKFSAENLSRPGGSNPLPEIKNQGASCCLGSFHFITASPPVS